MTSSSRRTARVLEILVAVLVFWSFGYTVMRASDLWWHLAAGGWIVDHRAVPRADSWSFTRAGAPWVHHEWLSDVVFDLWVRLFGRESLVVWKWGTIAATFTLLFVVLRRKTGSAAAGFVASLVAAATAAPFLDIRPHLWSLLGAVVLMVLALDRERPSWGVPALFLVWANLHGGFFFGLLALGAMLLPHVVFGDRAARVRTVSIVGASIAASLVNPNGLQAFAYPLKYAFDKTSPFRELGEWIPPFRPGGIPAPLYPWLLGAFALAAIGVVIARSTRKDTRWVVASLALGGLTLAMSLTSRRFILLFAIAQSLTLAPALALLLAPAARFIPALAPSLVVAAVAVFRLAPYPLGPRAFTYLTVEESFPVDTCDFIETNALGGKVFAYYNWGGYVTLRTRGRMTVYIDGRADTVYDAATYRRYLMVLNHEPGYLDVVESSGADFVLWDRRGDPELPARLAATGRWRALYFDPVSVLLVRAGGVLPVTLAEPAPSSWHAAKVGDDLLRSGRFAEAAEQFGRARAMPPHPRSACLGLARAQARAGRDDDARRTLASCRSDFPSPEIDEALRRIGESASR